MKQRLISIITVLSLIGSTVPVALAQTPTPAPSSNPTSEAVTEKLSNQINTLKEKIASRVAQLKLVEKKGMVGTVKEVDGTQIQMTDLDGNSRGVDVDEITKFSSPSAKGTFGISDIKPGMKLSVIGLYNKDSERILARYITADTFPIQISGTIIAINKDDYTVTVATEDGTPQTVDIDSVTKTSSYDGDSLQRSGFSKIDNNTRAIVIGYPDIKQKNRMVATRILLFPTLPKDPKVVVPQSAIDTSKETPVSTGSGKKLTPVK